MANRFPLTLISTTPSELPSGDALDLTGNTIYNNGAVLTLPTATGTFCTLAGTETLTNKTLSGATLTGTFAGDHTYSGTVSLSATTSLGLPVGTTAQRPTGASGKIRFNSDTTKFEGYNGSSWRSVGGGADGTGTDEVFFLNGKTVTGSYTIPTNYNAMTAGPVTINNGITVTVPDGSVWTIV